MGERRKEATPKFELVRRFPERHGHGGGRELGRVPIPGASVSVDGLKLTAETTGGRRNRIDTVLVHREPSRARKRAEQSAEG